MIDWTKETSGGKNYCGYCTGSPPSATCTSACFQESYTKDFQNNREDQIKRKAQYHKYKLMQYEFDKNDWAHFHDCIINATWETTKTSLSQDQMEELFMELPEDMQYEAFKWGMNDTPWRDNLYEWYQENRMK